MSDTIKVTLAYPYTDSDGKGHRADTTLSLPREDAKNLIHAGRARYPDPVAKKASDTPATPATAPKEK